MRLLRFIAGLRFLSEPRKLELYPPFFLMRIKVVAMSQQWRHIRIRLPLNTLSRNPGGIMFGGWQAALADPIAALACSRVFPGHSVWTRAMHVNFHQPGNSHLELRFDMAPEQEEVIARELAQRGRATPQFHYGFYREDGICCTEIINTVAIRPRGYQRSDHRAVDLTEL